MTEAASSDAGGLKLTVARTKEILCRASVTFISNESGIHESSASWDNLISLPPRSLDKISTSYHKDTGKFHWSFINLDVASTYLTSGITQSEISIKSPQKSISSTVQPFSKGNSVDVILDCD